MKRKGLQIVFRADSSTEIGTGHVMRCLTLADELRARGARIAFLCRELDGNLCDYIETIKGHAVFRMPVIPDLEESSLSFYERWMGASWAQDALQVQEILQELDPPADWLILDSYALDQRFESRMRQWVDQIMVIDDMADRPHDCDLLLDQNLYPNLETRYDALVPKDCRMLLGPRYALLRPEFASARETLRQRDGQVRRMLVFFGGSDPTEETEKALEALRSLKLDHVTVDVVVGGANPRKAQIAALCAELPTAVFHLQIQNMAELMASADLGIGAMGSATWERCYLGLPSITVVVAENQAETTAAVEAAKAVWNLGWSDEVTPAKLAKAVYDMMQAPDQLLEMSEAGLKLMGSRQDLGIGGPVSQAIYSRYEVDPA
ncbi:UDP-2,4-diacetamido-2,4,6-trideoxy-beta-L-altropyranose hydrolase [Tumebacillus permanentifrigoris]|uniref:UDP-2,4-diacetamido-2,4, 6-trideoxy-beta-L-altropyranose hydrolase n=1 Tax=Tumebacillus permanentifrigoris TaxID=378543 RepID=A0A316DEL4_9BACL|nr:UDP-2,4-diacetamido-2,4,6-trideoxy-beta-L-altropyranose hydrolase [Tumebacillus permanentifrigoris]PWK16176.1 UDP-2,4-diacetamido-2,4,6-trideoxy-beta-L-altropyranose hydrolase [Tumebacillus permanentifrigoris]